jgi:hypothetical protein
MDREAAALFIAAISLLVAGLSLGWQVAQWLLSAGRPKATLVHGIIERAGAYVGPVGDGGKRHNLRSLRQQGMSGPEVVGIQVTNHGRAPVTVEGVSVRTRGGVMSFVPHGDRIGPDLPHRLEPNTNASWYVALDRGVLLASSSREVLGESVTGIYMTAQLGNGKSVKTRRTLTA